MWIDSRCTDGPDTQHDIISDTEQDIISHTIQDIISHTIHHIIPDPDTIRDIKSYTIHDGGFYLRTHLDLFQGVWVYLKTEQVHLKTEQVCRRSKSEDGASLKTEEEAHL